MEMLEQIITAAYIVVLLAVVVDMLRGMWFYK